MTRYAEYDIVYIIYRQCNAALKVGMHDDHNLNGFPIVMRVVFIALYNVTKMDFVGARQVLEMKFLVLNNTLQV